MWSEVLQLQKDGGGKELLENLIGRYWRPVYWSLRAGGKCAEDEARDLTQEFFLRILEGEVLPGVDPQRGSFRNYLKGALKIFWLSERRKANQLKRGGGRRRLDLDFDSAVAEPEGLEGSPDEGLDRAWAFQILDEALKDLEEELRIGGREIEYRVFEAFQLAKSGTVPSYADLASRFGTSEADVWNSLRHCRRRLRRHLLNRIGPYVRNEAELFDELRELFRG